MIDNKIIVGISQGDINGVGLEVILKTLIDNSISEICVPVLFSSQKTVAYYRKVLDLGEFNFHPIKDFSQVNPKKNNVFACYDEEVKIDMGTANEIGGKYAAISLEKATEALINKQIDVLVTAPINKGTFKAESGNGIGHTEYLTKKIGGKSLMMLCSASGLRVALATNHLPVKNIASAISIDSIAEKIDILYSSLVKDFGIRKPKIAVLSLNPHAGDDGAIGTEEKEIIIPAIEKAKQDRLIYGPYSADGFFGNGTYKKFDAILAMYHDQGLIPFKTLSFNEGVNFTAGLPLIRTSPDHGTAFDIAGKNLADEQSLKNAIYMAIDVYRNRHLSEEISANPLAFSSFKKERG